MRWGIGAADGGGGEGRTRPPRPDGVRVEATVLREVKDRKVIVFKKKRRNMYRRKQGHRQRYTDLRVDQIV